MNQERWRRAPTEVWEDIFLKLPRCSLLSAQLACKEWKSILWNKAFQAAYQKLYPIEPHLVVAAIVGEGYELARDPELLAFNLTQNKWMDVPVKVKLEGADLGVSRDGLLCYKVKHGVWQLYNLVTKKTCKQITLRKDWLVSDIDPRKLSGCNEFLMEPFTYDFISGSVINKGCSPSHPLEYFMLPFTSSDMTVSISCSGEAHLELYDSTKGTWTTTRLRSPCQVQLGFYMSFFKCQGHGIIIVGYPRDDDLSVGVWKLENAPDKWTLLTKCPYGPSLKFNSACTDGSDQIWMLLGCNEKKFLANYDMASNTWTQLTPHAQPFRSISDVFFARF